MTTTDERAREAISLRRQLENSPRRVLAALGHPGYSDHFAEEIIGRWIATGQTIHALISAEVTR